MNVKLLTEHHLEFLSLKGGCTGSSESTLAKMPHCWNSSVIYYFFFCFFFSDNMENYCGDSINMILSGFEQGKIILNTNGYSHDWDITGQSNSCEMVLESW